MFRIYVPDDREPSPAPPAARFVPTIPDAVLHRHAARVLVPSEAATRRAGRRPNPTVYRHAVLLLPIDALGVLEELNEILRDIGLRLVEPLVTGREWTRTVAVELAPTDPFRPAAVDAWTALQRLRTVFDDGPVVEARRPLWRRGRFRKRVAPSLRELVDEIGLDHLLVAATPPGWLGGASNTATNGSPALGQAYDRPSAPPSWHEPVTVVLPTPGQPARGANASRRPIVAVLDSGVADKPRHPWLEPMIERGPAMPADAVVVVDPALQTTLTNDATNGVGVPRNPIVGFADEPFCEEPLRGELAMGAGHCTAISGIIRQTAPGAQIYALRVMHPDAFAHQADVLRALDYLAAQAEQGQPVDVVSLSLGYFNESDEEVRVTESFRTVLTRLLAAGVPVVAAAGNFATDRKFYPAALAPELRQAGAPMISVGALNPNGTIAMFSNEGDWVSCYASGSSVVTTFPSMTGSWTPAVQAGRRESPDSDDFRVSMFAAVQGSSFATPVIAGRLAAALHDCCGMTDGADDDNRTARIRAAWKAWEIVRGEGGGQ
jgi:hypothetical protein